MIILLDACQIIVIETTLISHQSQSYHHVLYKMNKLTLFDNSILRFIYFVLFIYSLVVV